MYVSGDLKYLYHLCDSQYINMHSLVRLQP